jgi:NAD(P)-dependent dehydrogenase (short-subunit alcohol dehydrogenase family)
LSLPLNNRIAVVTGATHGLGEATAKHLASLGATIVLIARGRQELDRVASALRQDGAQVLAISCDTSDSQQTQDTASKIVQELGGVDILVNNVGIPAPVGFKETSFEDWDRTISVNLSSAFYMTRALWDAMISRDDAYVIVVSGTMGIRGGASPAYGSAKFGLTALTRSIAVAGKQHNIRASVLYPGGMDTGWRGAPIGVKPRSETMDPDEVARYIGYLVSTPPEFVVNEAVLSPLADTFL